jgi:hypothetical protein
MHSVMLENKGNGQFVSKPLPAAAQLGPIYGLCSGDYDGDGHLDLLLTGNSYATESIGGRLDAFNGLLLTGNGKGNFTPVSASKGGFLVEGDGKGLADLRLGDGSTMVLAAQNNSSLKTFVVPVSKDIKIIVPQLNDAMIEATYSSGKKLRFEPHYGSGYLSQSSRKVSLPGKDLVQVTAIDFQGKTRNISF